MCHEACGLAWQDVLRKAAYHSKDLTYEEAAFVQDGRIAKEEDVDVHLKHMKGWSGQP